MADDLGSTVAALHKELDEQSEPHADYKAVKDDVDKASGLFRSNYSRGTTKGPKTREKFEDAAALYLKGVGWDVKGKQQSASIMRGWLGDDNYAVIQDAIKRDDIDEIMKLLKDAYIAGTSSAKLLSTTAKIGELPPDSRIDLGKKGVEGLGGTDYVAVATNPVQYSRDLGRKKAIADAYTHEKAA